MTTQLQETVREKAYQVSFSGYDLINSPRLNKGTASAWRCGARWLFFLSFP